MKTKVLLSVFIFFIALCITTTAEPLSVPGGQKNIKDVAKKAYSSVVTVEARNGWAKVATGVVIDKDGHVLTTALITPRDEELYIITPEGERIEAEFLGMDSITHLALVKAKMKNARPIPMGDSQKLESGSWIGVVGISPEKKPMITQGIVSSVAPDTLRLNVWVGPGASGSPVINEDGDMVGLIRGVYSDNIVLEFRGEIQSGRDYMVSRAEGPSSGMAMAIPIHVVKKVASEIKEKGKVERGWLGASIAENDEGHVEILVVEDESPAELAKLKEGDIILEFEGKKVTTSKMLVEEIRLRKPGDRVDLKIEREEDTENIKVQLGEFTQNEIIREFESKFPSLFPRERTGFQRIPREVRPEQFMRAGKRRFIGVYLDELNKELAAYFGVEDGTGLLITRLTEDGPAEKAGMKVGDVILKADGKSVRSIQGLTNYIQKQKKEDEVEIEFLRDKKSRTLKVKVDEEQSQGIFVFEDKDQNSTGLFDKSEVNTFFNESFDKSFEELKMLQEKNKNTGKFFLGELKESQEKKVMNFNSFWKRYRGIRV